jgi:hypothetical protein
MAFYELDSNDTCDRFSPIMGKTNDIVTANTIFTLTLRLIPNAASDILFQNLPKHRLSLDR